MSKRLFHARRPHHLASVLGIGLEALVVRRESSFSLGPLRIPLGFGIACNSTCRFQSRHHAAPLCSTGSDWSHSQCTVA